MKIELILCPTDFSDCSRAAVEFARELAAQLGARLRLVHVFQLPQYVGWEDGMTLAAASAQFLTDLRARADADLRQVAQRCRDAGVQTEAELVEGVPYQQIAQMSESADLVVMGTHGRTGLPRVVLGSVAERVVRLAKCPVVSVPAPEPKPS